MSATINSCPSDNLHALGSTIVQLKQDEPQNRANSFAVLPGISSDSLLSMLRQNNQNNGTPLPPAVLYEPSQQSQNPVFPDLSHSDPLQMNVAEIAREAMRLTKETLRNEEKKHGYLAFNTDITLGQFSYSSLCMKPTTIIVSYNRLFCNSTVQTNEHDVPVRLKTDHNISSTSEDEGPLAVIKKSSSTKSAVSGSLRLNKFVRRLHDMLVQEKDEGIVEWRRGLLVLHNTEVFAKRILPKYFNTRNFKTFRRQLNYYA